MFLLVVKRVWRLGLLLCGFFSLGLGILGAFLPLLPTTVFLLVAAFCFARSSERFHEMLLAHRWSGPYVRSYQDGRPMSSNQMFSALGGLWLSITLSAALVRTWWVVLILLGVAVSVTTYLIARNRRLQTAASSAIENDRRA